MLRGRAAWRCFVDPRRRVFRKPGDRSSSDAATVARRDRRAESGGREMLGGEFDCARSARRSASKQWVFRALISQYPTKRNRTHQTALGWLVQISKVQRQRLEQARRNSQPGAVGRSAHPPRAQCASPRCSRRDPACHAPFWRTLTFIVLCSTVLFVASPSLSWPLMALCHPLGQSGSIPYTHKWA
jgi:hypothetical protein